MLDHFDAKMLLWSLKLPKVKIIELFVVEKLILLFSNLASLSVLQLIKPRAIEKSSSCHAVDFEFTFSA